MAEEQETHQTATTTTEEKLHWKCLDFGWLIYTWSGRFKCCEFVTTFLGFILISSVDFFESESRYEFYVFVGVFSWVMVFLHMLLGIPHIIEKLPAVIIQPMVFLILCSLATVVWLIASCLVVSKTYGNGTVGAGATLGFITMFLFFFEAVYYFICLKRGIVMSSTRTTTTTTTTTSREMHDTAAGGEESYPPEY